MAEKPILFLDVDGPLNPYMAKPERRPEGYKTIRARPAGTLWENERHAPLRVWLNESHGPELLKLPYELVWATTWEREANVWIGPHIGLPELPVVEFTGSGRSTKLHWKTKQLIAYAAGRPFVWVDDECRREDHVYVTKTYGEHGKILRVSPYTGLTDHHFDQLAEMFSQE